VSYYEQKYYKGESMKKFINLRALFISVSMMTLAVTALSGCKAKESSAATAPTLSPSGLTGDALAFSRFTEPVDVHIGVPVDPIDTSLPPGDSAGNNVYTRYLKEKYNINVIVDWSASIGDNYNQKVSLAIASNTLPDALVVTYDLILKAAKSDMLYDITEIFNKYASTQVQSILDSTNGRAQKMVTFDGKMVALPHVMVKTDGVNVMNIQKHWLDQYGLPVPRTLDDIENAARIFKQKQPAGSATVPIVGVGKGSDPYSSFIKSSNNTNAFDPVFSAYDAFPGYFLDNGDGTAAYGSLSPNMKPALERLARWYKEGLLDPEVGTRDNPDELVYANQAGIRFAPWWAIGYGNDDSFRNNPNANWQAYPVYTADGKWNVHLPAAGLNACLINKNASPDVVAAIIIMYNALVRDESSFDRSTAIEWYPLRVVAAPADETEYTYHELTKVLQGITKPEDYNDPLSVYRLLYNDTLAVRDVIPGYQPDRELAVGDFDLTKSGDFQRLYSVMIGDRPYATAIVDKEVYSITYSMTDTLSRVWPNLWKMELETGMKIITGQLDVNAWDKFVADWKAQGGQAALDEIVELYLK
jgi:multiple sugar transport system substrate-binding protein/putative aldouronate transport system substrate-binding protein